MADDPADTSLGKFVDEFLRFDTTDGNEAAAQAWFRDRLEAFGFDVVPANNGAEAIDLARRNPPDLVLMDIMMPEVDGFEATRRLRGFPETRDIPIITLTAMEGARSRALEAGADDFLAKPINSGQLLEKVRDWLNS